MRAWVLGSMWGQPHQPSLDASNAKNNQLPFLRPPWNQHLEAESLRPLTSSKRIWTGCIYKMTPLSCITFPYAMGLLLDFCSVSLDCLSRHVSHCTGFIVGSLPVCFVYRSSFTGFLAVIAYLSFQMNFTINLVMSRKKTNLTLFFVDSNLEITFFML